MTLSRSNKLQGLVSITGCPLLSKSYKSVGKSFPVLASHTRFSIFLLHCSLLHLASCGFKEGGLMGGTGRLAWELVLP